REVVIGSTSSLSITTNPLTAEVTKVDLDFFLVYSRRCQSGSQVLAGATCEIDKQLHPLKGSNYEREREGSLGGRSLVSELQYL
ncbi:MAG TPA: hypothetical protein VFV34_24440, partial [Blastocatellia bacterium]|nr:hypothetical protein [Blastocatellia bacterium]